MRMLLDAPSLLASTAFLTAGVRFFVVSFLLRMFYVCDDYSPLISGTPCSQILLLRVLKERCVLWTASTFWRGARIGSGWGIDRRLRFLAHVSFSSTTNDRDEGRLMLVMYRWRFEKPIFDAEDSSFETLIDAKSKDALDSSNRVLVYRYDPRRYTCLSRATEIGLPFACPTLGFSLALADAMLRAYHATGRGNFVICGRPGRGKSIAARCLSHRLDAVHAMFNPAHGDEVSYFLEGFAASGRPYMVLVIEEVDGDVESMLRNAQPARDEQHQRRQAAFDKKAWCALFDRLQFHAGVLVVATTNKTLAWLRQMDGDHFDSALFRVGRFNHFIDADDPQCAARLTMGGCRLTGYRKAVASTPRMS